MDIFYGSLFFTLVNRRKATTKGIDMANTVKYFIYPMAGAFKGLDRERYEPLSGTRELAKEMYKDISEDEFDESFEIEAVFDAQLKPLFGTGVMKGEEVISFHRM